VCHKVVGCCEADTPVDVYCRALSRMVLTKMNDDEVCTPYYTTILNHISLQSSLTSLHVLLSEVKKVSTSTNNATM